MPAPVARAIARGRRLPPVAHGCAGSADPRAVCTAASDRAPGRGRGKAPEHVVAAVGVLVVWALPLMPQVMLLRACTSMQHALCAHHRALCASHSTCVRMQIKASPVNVGVPGAMVV